jgi:hypothetical protein
MIAPSVGAAATIVRRLAMVRKSIVMVAFILGGLDERMIVVDEGLQTNRYYL